MKKLKSIAILLLVGLVLCSVIIAASAESVKLRYVFPGTSDVERNYVENLVNAFNESHDDIDITIEYIPWDDLMIKLISMTKAGNPPDMAWLPVSYSSDLESMGFLTDIDKYVRNWEGLDHIYKPFFEQFTYDGKIYTIPTMAEVVLTGGHFRKDILEKFYGSADKIKTWNDWLEALEVCHNKDRDGDGKIDTYGLGLEPSYAIWVVESLARNNGPMYLRDILDVDKKGQWLEVFDVLKRLSKYNLPGVESMSYKDLQRAFVDDLIVFSPFVGSWMFGNLYNIDPDAVTEDNIGIMAGPVGPSHTGKALSGVQIYGPYAFKDIPDSHKAASAEFIKFQGDEENGARFPGFMHTPARDDITVEKIMKYSPYTQEAYGWYLKYWLEIGNDSVTREKLPNANYLQDLYANIYLDLMSDDITVEEAYNKVYEACKESWK